MGIQINGQTDRISAVDGSFSIQDLAEVNITGVATASNFKSGTSNVHSTGYECTNINATGIVTAASANFTGNVSVGGTLTYQDVTNIDSVGVITARAGVKVPDSQKIFAGTGDDLEIYHDGSNSAINDKGTGNLYIQGSSNIYIRDYDTSESHIIMTKNGSVQLYHDGSKKFETKSDGVDITGELQCDTLDVDGVSVFTGGTATFGDSSSGYSGTPVFAYANTTAYNQGTIQAKNFGSGGANFIGFDGGGNATSYINTDGSASFYGNVSIADKIIHTGDTNTAIRFPAADTITAETGGSERLRITSDGKIGLQGNTAPLAKVHIGTLNNSALSVQTLFVEGAKTGYANYAGLPQNQLCLYDTTTSTAGSGGAISFAADCGGSQQTWIAAIESQRDSSTNDASNYAGSLVFWTRPAQSTPTEKLRIDSAGTIKCGTSSTLKAEINSAIGGHQFISQCSDNNNGFEIYQKHGSTTTRNTFAVYANTGGGGAQELQFSVRGDGCVTKPLSPAFSANLAGGNLNAATHNNVIIFNNEHFDKSNSYDASNGRFTAPVAGLYYFGVQIYGGFDGAGVRVLHAKFQKNGSDVASTDLFGGASNHGGTYYHPTGCGHMLIDLAVNDYIEFNSGGFSGSSGNALIYAASGTRFFGYLVG